MKQIKHFLWALCASITMRQIHADPRALLQQLREIENTAQHLKNMELSSAQQGTFLRLVNPHAWHVDNIELYEQAALEALSHLDDENQEIKTAALELARLVITKALQFPADTSVNARLLHKELKKRGITITLPTGLHTIPTELMSYIFMKAWKSNATLANKLCEVGRRVKTATIASVKERRPHSVGILGWLVTRGDTESIDEAISAAQNLIQNHHFDAQSVYDSLFLFRALVNHNQAIEDATGAALANLNHQHPLVKKEAWLLLKTLLNKGYASDGATIHAAGEQDPEIAKLIFSLIIQSGHETEETIAQATYFALTIISNPDNEDILDHAFEVLASLIRHGHAIQEITESGKSLLQSQHTYAKQNALVVFNMLASHGKSVSDAINAARFGINSEIDDERINASRLFATLIKDGHGIAEAIENAQIALNRGLEEGRDDVEEVLNLFIELVKYNHAIPQAINAAQATFNDNEMWEHHQKALQLFEALVERDHAFEEATVAADTAADNADHHEIKIEGLDLLTILVKHNRAILQALNAFYANINNQNEDIQGAVRDLQQALIAQGVAI